MFRRLIWLSVGLAIGFGSSLWVMRFVRTTIERYSPERVSTDLAGAAQRFRADLRAAVADGREAMRAREAELRAQLDLRTSR